MYAVIETGGKQYRVSVGQEITVETLATETGDVVNFDNVLLLSGDNGVSVGNPFVPNASVQGTVTEHGRHKKINIIKFKRRKHHMKRQGHRQNYTKVKITAITQ